jgi:hypothetical protein
LTFAAYSPKIAARQKMPFCAPQTDQTEETVPAQIGGSASASLTTAITLCNEDLAG